MGGKNNPVFFLAFCFLAYLGCSTRHVPQELTADKLLDRNRVVQIEIEMPRDDWQALCNQYRDFAAAFADPTAKPFSYFKGHISIDGVKVGDVGIRKKGFLGSQDNYRPSLKVKFDEYVDQQPVMGLTHLTLNNNKQDRSLLSQSLTYHLFRKAGIHAPRCNFATVTVNGDYLGIYSHVESIKEPYLENEFGDASGKLYEGTLADFYPKAIGRLEAKTTASDEDRTAVMKLATLLNSKEAISLGEIEALVDVDNFLKYWAIESLIGFWDGYTQNQNNYFVYQNPQNGKMYFMPWGADGCFSGSRGFRRFRAGSSVAVVAESILANRLYHMEGMPARYKETLAAILNESWNEDELLKEVDRIRRLIVKDIDHLQRDSLYAMDDVRRFIRERREKVMTELEDDWPAYVDSTPRKPTYTIDVGSAAGSFSTNWGTPADGQQPEATVKLQLNGSDVDVNRISVTAGFAERRGFGRRGFGGFGRSDDSNRPVSITLACETSAEQVLTLTMNVPTEDFVAGKKVELQITGTLEDGQADFGFPPRTGKPLQGTMRLDHAGTSEGDRVSGVFDVKISEMRGGMMDRRRR